MQWINDPTGRFQSRPWYSKPELDEICEAIAVKFLKTRSSNREPLLSTDDLITLVERDTSRLVLNADLHTLGRGIVGATSFFTDGSLPLIQIDQGCRPGPYAWQHQLFRFTLMHEYSHALLHDDLIPVDPKPGRQHFRQTCSEEQVGPTSSVTDWMEWQANYSAGALLMPTTHVTQLVDRIEAEWVSLSSPHARRDLIRQMQRCFGVSPTAARIRLSQVAQSKPPPPNHPF
jgi:hypothetical protein